ncbi:aconitase X swivel domain-containing protein [Brevibacillus sp. H7]|uniref:aconitase X swivel domain-containing protein n=1 Tax=Brevibacillus sp. H7 TaxID=3349138 RepID=UPI003800A0C1
MKHWAFPKRVVVPGQGSGPVLATTVPLSFWGGLDPRTGTIVDRHHPLSGQSVAGRVFVMPYGRGSSTASGVLLEAIMTKHAPSAILLSEVDEILALGAIVADEIFSKRLPVIVLDPDSFQRALQANYACIEEDGTVILQ